MKFLKLVILGFFLLPVLSAGRKDQLTSQTMIELAGWYGIELTSGSNSEKLYEAGLAVEVLDTSSHPGLLDNVLDFFIAAEINCPRENQYLLIDIYSKIISLFEDLAEGFEGKKRANCLKRAASYYPLLIQLFFEVKDYVNAIDNLCLASRCHLNAGELDFSISSLEKAVECESHNQVVFNWREYLSLFVDLQSAAFEGGNSEQKNRISTLFNKSFLNHNISNFERSILRRRNAASKVTISNPMIQNRPIAFGRSF